MTLYENRIRRDVARDKKELDELQTTRKAAEARAREEAELLLNQSILNKEPLAADAVTEVNGFEFSAATLRSDLNRKAALAAARFYQANNWDPAKPFPALRNIPNQEPNPLPKAA